MTVSTNQSATCRYATSSGVSYAHMNSTTTSLGTTHSWGISAPVVSMEYYYYVRCINQFNQSSDELAISFTTVNSTLPPPISGSGGGSVGGGGETASTREFANYSVDVGEGRFCTVTIMREMTSGTHMSVLTTTLENIGGSDCNMQNFTFFDTIPSSFPAINDITFNPLYTSREGWQVSFNFPTFSGGESKTLTYSVNGWVGSSKAKNFTVYDMTANKKQAVAPVQPPIPPIVPSTNEMPSWIPTKLPDIFGPPPATNATSPPPESPPQTDFTSLFLAGFVILLILVCFGGLVFYLRRKRRRGL